MSLFIKHLGDTGPLVLFESGVAASHLNWMGLAPQVAKFARVLLYDRAGYGYSPPRVEPRTAAQCAREVPLDEPAIIVAHSFGALIARSCAEQRPDLVRALVLIDPIVLSEFWPATAVSRARLRHGARVARTFGWAARAGLVKPLIQVMSGRQGRVPRALEQLLSEIRRLPPETWPVIRDHWSRPQSFLTMQRYLESLETSCCEGAQFCSLGDLPLTVISGAHLTPDQLAEHAKWAKCSSQGRHLIAPSGRHWVHLDEPEFVIQAIRDACQLSAQPV